MKNDSSPLDYDDFDAIVERARIERSIALGSAIAGLMTTAMAGLTRAGNALEVGTRGSNSNATANAAPILDASGRR